MLPMLEREIVSKRGLTTREEILDFFAIGQCTPGIIAVNTTYSNRLQKAPNPWIYRRYARYSYPFHNNNNVNSCNFI